MNMIDMTGQDLEDLISDVLSNPDAKRAYQINRSEREILGSISEKMHQNNWNTKALSIASGVPRKEIINILKDKGKTNLRSILAICHALGLELLAVQK